LVVDGVALSKDGAIQDARNISLFFRQGGAYLAIKSYLESQQAELLIAESDISSKINSTLVELEYQRGRLLSLEALAKRFPADSRVTSQVVDPKDSGAKYLPLSTQIIAINTDINNNTEALTRLRDRQAQVSTLRLWLDQALPIFASSYKGLQINQELLTLEAAIRKQKDGADPKAFIFVNSLRNNLLENETRFKWGLIESNTIVAKKTGILKATAGGLAIAGFLMLVFLLGRKVLRNLKKDKIA
jgi:hypothetical protein